MFPSDNIPPVNIIEVNEITEDLVASLLSVWESSVRATHTFLSESEILEIKKYVPEALRNVEHLAVAYDDTSSPVAFMGVQDSFLEMLFVKAEERGKGIGRRLLERGIKEYGVQKLSVNEQNPQAKGFYEHMGFIVYSRSEFDGQGKPYPLLYMKLKDN